VEEGMLFSVENEITGDGINLKGTKYHFGNGLWDMAGIVLTWWCLRTSRANHSCRLLMYS
jgi:hypothetical protein